MRNIASHLPDMARRQPHALAVVYPHGRDWHGRVSYTHYTFAQLDQDSDRLAFGLEAIGIGRGARTVLMVTPSLDFFALVFALFKVGAVPVLVDPGMGVRNLGICLAEAQPHGFIGVPRAHVARLILRWSKATIKINVVVGPNLPGCGVSLAKVRQLGETKLRSMAKDAPRTGERYPIAQSADGEIAAILFTSGSTGVPKGAVYTHEIFNAQVDQLRQLYGIEPGEIDLPTFPLFALFAPALGMTAIIPDMNASQPGKVDPRKIVEAIENFGVTNMFGSPALIDRVGQYLAENRITLPTLRRAISAGAPVPAKVLKRFAGMLAPAVQVFTPYGATEALPVCSIGSNEILLETSRKTAEGAGVCIGKPVPWIDLRIIRISDDPILNWSDGLLLPAGQIGEIIVAGAVVTREYFGRPQSTALAKIHDPETGRLFHRMGDVGYLDDQGRVWFCGRKSHRVPTADGTLFTIPCEAVFNQHPKVNRTALVGVPSSRHAPRDEAYDNQALRQAMRSSGAQPAATSTGVMEPVLCVELEKSEARCDRIVVERELLALGASHQHTRSIRRIVFHPSFPVDVRHNAKIFREKLAVWAATR